MTVTADQLAQIRLQANLKPYDPGKDFIRSDVVIQVGSYWNVHVGLSVADDQYSRFQVDPPRRDSVAVYFLSTVRVGKTESFYYYSVDWPHFWRRDGSSWVLIFPERAKLPVVPVIKIPSNQTKPSGSGPRVVLDHRDLTKHIRESRARAVAKQRHAASHSKLQFLPFPHFKRLNPEQINWSGRHIWNSAGGPFNEVAYPSLRYYRAYTSVDTPGFTRKKHGKLPVNPYSLVRIMTEDPMAYDIRKNNPPYPAIESEEYIPSSGWAWALTAPSHLDLAYNKALASLINRGEFGLDGNLAQDFAQYGQTVRQIADSAKRIALSLHYVKRLKFKDAWQALATPTTSSRGKGYSTVPRGKEPQPWKSVAENWLAFQYGWKPLLEDIDASMRSLANVMVQDPGVIRTVRGKGGAVTKSREEIGVTSDYYVKTGDRFITTYSQCTIGVRYTIDNRLKSFLAQTGFTNPINLAWEVLPYSFVVDWFYPIGPYLTTLSAFDGLAFVDGFVSRWTKRYYLSEENYDGKWPSNYYTKLHWTRKHRFWQEYMLVNRVKLFAFPSAIMPQVKNPVSVVHALNALALLRAAFK